MTVVLLRMTDLNQLELNRTIQSLQLRYGITVHNVSVGSGAFAVLKR